MKSKKTIAVTMRYDYINSIKETRNSIDFRIVDWIFSMGMEPLLVPNNIKILKFINLKKIDGIIFSGGNNVNNNSIRNNLEYKLLILSKKKNIPVLGICHGLQIINKFEGGTLKKVNNHIRKKHEILSKIKEYPKIVNSFHNYSISKIGKNLKILARSSDGEIEAIKHEKYNWLGWMWHPERDKKFNRNILNIAKQMFK